MSISETLNKIRTLEQQLWETKRELGKVESAIDLEIEILITIRNELVREKEKENEGS